MCDQIWGRSINRLHDVMQTLESFMWHSRPGSIPSAQSNVLLDHPNLPADRHHRYGTVMFST